MPVADDDTTLEARMDAAEPPRGAGPGESPDPVETEAAREGADIELTAQDAPAGPPVRAFPPDVLEAARQALPGWDVQPDVLVRTVSAPEGAAALRTSLEQIARDAGRAPEIVSTGEAVTVRIRAAGGPPPALLELAAALDSVLGGHAPAR